MKVAGLRRLGATVKFCEPTQAVREAACAAAVERFRASGAAAHVVPSSNDALVIAGQGTLGLEILQDAPAIDAIVAPVGGGGLLAGVATAAAHTACCSRGPSAADGTRNDTRVRGVKGVSRNTRVVGAEPLNADDAARSLAAGPRQSEPLPHRPGMPDTIADGLRACVSRRTLAIMRGRVDRVVTVTEEEIRAAVTLVYDHLKLVVEPSAGVGVAVALLPRFRPLREREGWRRVVVVLCGGNVDLADLPALLVPDAETAAPAPSPAVAPARGSSAADPAELAARARLASKL